MADTLKIDNTGQTDAVDIVGGSPVFRLLDRGWRTGTPSPLGEFFPSEFGAAFDPQGYDHIEEVFALRGSGNNAALDPAIDSYGDMIEKIRNSRNDPFNLDDFWLYWNRGTEGLKRSLIYSMRYNLGNRFSTPFNENEALSFLLSLTRHPLWETPTTTTVNFGSLSSLGGKGTITGVPGNAPARIDRLRLDGDNIAGEISKVWVGIRPEYAGQSGFVPFWEAESTAQTGGMSTIFTDTTDQTGQSLWSNNARIQINFATQTGLVRRVQWVIDDVSGGTNQDHFRGRYLVLCRMASGVSDEYFGFQLRQGWAKTFLVQSTPVSDVRYFKVGLGALFYELGEIEIPPDHYSVSAAELGRFGLDLYVERATPGGVGNIFIDGICLIPNEHIVTIDGAELRDIGGGETQPTEVYTFPDDTTTVRSLENNVPEIMVQHSPNNFYVPVGNAMYVHAGQRQAGQIIGDTISAQLRYFPRWLNYRGS